MSTDDQREPGQHPRRGALGYLQLPATDIAASAEFYRAVLGWSGELTYGSFEGPGLIGQWTSERAPAADAAGPVMWFCVDELAPALGAVVDRGGSVLGRPQLDQGERWLVEVLDPAGNRLGLVVPVRPPRPQTLVTVRDVEASSRWYQDLLGLRSDHGGPQYERLVSAAGLVLQLHHGEVEHDHGPIGDPTQAVGNGVLVWFEVSDFDDAVARAERLAAPIVMPVHRNPPSGEGNGPGHRELWITDPDGYTVVLASPDGEAFEF